MRVRAFLVVLNPFNKAVTSLQVLLNSLTFKDGFERFLGVGRNHELLVLH